MNYPSEILPQSHFKYLDISLINQLNNIYLVRRSNKATKEETFKKSGTVIIDSLVGSGSQFKKYSLNLLGGLFKVEHILFRQKGKGIETWKLKETINLEDFKDCFEKAISFIPIYVSLKNIHNISIPYNISDKKEVAEYKKTFEAFGESLNSDSKTILVQGKSFIVHKPTKLNYWHVELHSEDIGAKEAKLKTVKESSSGKWQEYSQFFQENIIKACSYKVQNIGEVPEHLYSNDKT